MSPTKRLLEGGCSPPTKYRLIISEAETAAKSFANDCSASDKLLVGSEVDSGKAVMKMNYDSSVVIDGNKSCHENNHNEDFSEETQLSTSKPKNSLRLLRKRQEDDRKAAQVKESKKNFYKLIAEDSDGDALAALNNTETRAPTSVLITHQGAEPLKIDWQPAQDEDEDNLIPRRKKRMFAVLLSYSGKGYLGLQK